MQQNLTKEYWKSIAPEEFPMRGRWVDNWFSNMVISPITINGVVWASVENYYQSRKAKTEKEADLFLTYSPSDAKKMGRRVEIREDWDKLKETFMLTVLVVKFNQPAWKQRLLDTEEELIVEWNNWGDKYWGVDIRSFEGQNRLGEILMEVRKLLKKL